MPPPIFRFAPSPNGYLHLGHALSALINFDMARWTRGRLVLRIEDIDTSRCRPEYEEAIYEDIAWLGIAWEKPVRRQSEHFDDYRRALARLERDGLIYPSFESRAEIAALIVARERQGDWPRDPDGAPLYPGGAAAVDDALQGITHVVRGRDLLHATSVHRLLQALLGLPEPIYHHHRLVLDGDGRKLSKSTNATALRALRQSGETATDIRRIVGLE